MPFAETTGKRIDLGRNVEFIFGHVKCEMLATLVEMTNDSWRNMLSPGIGLHCRFTCVSHQHVDDITVMGLGGITRERV